MKREKRLGIIAGSGGIPLCICRKAKEEGYTCIVAGIQNEFDEGITEQADSYACFEVKDFLKLVSFFKKKDVHQIIFAGKIRHRNMYSKDTFPLPLSSLLEGTENRNPDEIARAVFNYIESQGIEVMDPSRFLSDFFCEQGVLTKGKISPAAKEDVDYGWPLAKQMADLEIGQTVIVKDKAVVAVEAMEGTDEAIIRGGLLGGEGCVVVKVARTRQDARIDQPAVGLKTVQNLKKAGCSALCIEADKVLFMNKDKALKLAEQSGITVISRKTDTSLFFMNKSG